MNLRRIRIARGLSVPQLVEITKVPRRTIQDIEKRGDCKLSTAAKLADGLHITIDELMRDENIENIKKEGFRLTCVRCGKNLEFDFLDYEDFNVDSDSIMINKFFYPETSFVEIECKCGNKVSINFD